jgi:hypothetical protein
MTSAAVAEVHAAWRHAQAELIAAYDAWCAAAVGQRRDAYAVYLAAADREACAAARLSAIAATA